MTGRVRTMTEKRPDRLTLVAFTLLVVLGGTNFIAVRFTNFELPPFWGATLRFAVSALIFWVALFVGRHSLPRGRAFVGVVIYGALSFGLSYAFLYWGLVHVQAGIASVVLALVPLVTFFFALAHRLETFRWRGLLGALVAVGGIALAFGEQPSGSLPIAPLLALLAGAACIAEAGVVAKLYPRIHPVVVNALAMLVGTLILLALSLLAGEARVLPSAPQTWAAFIYLVLFGSVTVFVLFLFVIRRWTASATSYTFVLFPFVAVALSAWLEGEAITLPFLLGGLLVLLGVWAGALARLPKRGEEATAKSQ